MLNYWHAERVLCQFLFQSFNFSNSDKIESIKNIKIQYHILSLNSFFINKIVDTEAVVDKYLERREKATVLIAKYQLVPGDYILISHVRESPTFNVDVWVEAKVSIFNIKLFQSRTILRFVSFNNCSHWIYLISRVIAIWLLKEGWFEISRRRKWFQITLV